MKKKIIIIGAIVIFLISLTSFIFVVYKFVNRSNQQTDFSNEDNTITEDKETNPSQNSSCIVDRTEYSDGESFASNDSCNTCTCDDGIVSCTEKACFIESQEIIVQPMLDGGFSYKLYFNADIPADAEIINLESLLVYKNNDFTLGISIPPSYVSGSFDEASEFKILQSGNEQIFRVNPSTASYHPYLEEYFIPFQNSFFYSSSYIVGNCEHVIDNPPACGTDLLDIDFLNDEDSQALFVDCGVNSETDAKKYCDEIVKSISVEKIL